MHYINNGSYLDEYHDRSENNIATESKLKNIFLKKSMLAYILKIDDFSLNNAQPNKQENTYTNQPTERELRQQEEIAQLTKEKERLQRSISEKEKYIAESITRKSNQVAETIQKYNIRERQTHQMIIYALIMSATGRDLSTPKYKKANGKINITATADTLATDLQLNGINISGDSLRKKISEILNTQELENVFIGINDKEGY